MTSSGFLSVGETARQHVLGIPITYVEIQFRHAAVLQVDAVVIETAN